MRKDIFIVLIGTFAIHSAGAATFTISSEDPELGTAPNIEVEKNERLQDIAKRNRIGLTELARVNPDLNPKQRLAKGTKVTLPTAYHLPPGPREGIVLNLAERRLYYFHPDGVTVSTYPVGVGRQGWSTPQGETTIVAKEANPAWRPPVSIRREAARRGRTLPLVVPPGPRNPLGRFAMRLGFGGILIHGTTQPGSVGHRSSHGCIRMYAKDIAELYKMVPVGTPVRIINEPVKATKAAKHKTTPQ